MGLRGGRNRWDEGRGAVERGGRVSRGRGKRGRIVTLRGRHNVIIEKLINIYNCNIDEDEQVRGNKRQATDASDTFISFILCLVIYIICFILLSTLF